MDKFKRVIKQVYKDNFCREITDEEAEGVLKNALSYTKEQLEKTKGFSEKVFERYIGGVDSLLFSPANIHLELRKIIQEVGEDKLIHMGKYKRARELEIASRFCIATYKRLDQKYMIKAQDNPDIILVLMRAGSLDNKSLRGSRLEVMTIPEIIKSGLDNDLPVALADFVKEKKFTKDYGLCALIISCDFRSDSLNFNKISEILSKVKPNPYESIWFTGITNPELTNITVMQVYPQFRREDFDLAKEPNILY